MNASRVCEMTRKPFDSIPTADIAVLRVVKSATTGGGSDALHHAEH
jgi:hypothetical protein